MKKALQVIALYVVVFYGSCWLLAMVHPGSGRIVGHPKLGPSFRVALDPQDSLGSVIKCEDQIYARSWRTFWLKHGTGTCNAPAGSLGAGKTMRLDPIYPNVTVGVEGVK